MHKKLEHILCVDDEPDVLRLITMCLETVGQFRVSTATHGQQALTRAAELAPDIILLDVMMPGMDGPATLAQLRANPHTSAIPVIFMTARIRGSEVDEYVALGANGVIAKPFDPMQISAEVQAIWNRTHE